MVGAHLVPFIYKYFLDAAALHLMGSHEPTGPVGLEQEEDRESIGNQAAREVIHITMIRDNGRIEAEGIEPAAKPLLPQMATLRGEHRVGPQAGQLGTSRTDQARGEVVLAADVGEPTPAPLE